MRFFILSYLLSLALILTTPPVVIAGSFSSPFVKHGVVNQRMGLYQHMGVYQPKFEKLHKKTFPRHGRRVHHLFPHNRYLIYPVYSRNRASGYSRNRASPPPKIVYKKTFVLNPDIFNPSPKTPLTLVVEDGVVVDSYRGY